MKLRIFKTALSLYVFTFALCLGVAAAFWLTPTPKPKWNQIDIEANDPEKIEGDIYIPNNVVDYRGGGSSTWQWDDRRCLFTLPDRNKTYWLPHCHDSK